MAPTFDPTVLVDQVIAERKLEENTITWTRGRLRFSPGMAGDGSFIDDTVAGLKPDERRVLDDMAATIDEPRLHAGYRALHVNPDVTSEARLAAYRPAVVLGLLIADRLGVNVPV